METTYIITFVVDGRDWSSRPIKGSLQEATDEAKDQLRICLLYTSPSPRDQRGAPMPAYA